VIFSRRSRSRIVRSHSSNWPSSRRRIRVREPTFRARGSGFGHCAAGAFDAVGEHEDADFFCLGFRPG